MKRTVDIVITKKFAGDADPKCRPHRQSCLMREGLEKISDEVVGVLKSD